MKYIAIIMTMSVFLIVSPGVHGEAAADTGPYIALFDEICQIVEKHFYNPSIIEEKFPGFKREARGMIQTVSTQSGFSEAVNTMLKRLDASHTYYLSPHDYEYFQLAAVFSALPPIKNLFPNREVTYPTVGIITETIDDRVYIASVLSGSAAEHAGLLGGDEILDVDGKPYRPIDSLKAQVGKNVTFTIKRSVSGPVRTFSLKPALMNPKTEMLEAEKAGIRVIETQGVTIGYIHIYSYAGEEYHQELVSAISHGPFQHADALIIDLRYGLGGADPAYLNIFNPHIPVISWMDNTGKTGRYDSQWRKPAVFLVNKTSRSGKELLAFGARKYGLATVIGERTAGAVTAGRLFPLSNGDLLYLAVRGVRIDGVVLEGVGVAPDIEVPMDIRYAEGKDAQLEKAIDHMVEKVKHRQKTAQ